MVKKFNNTQAINAQLRGSGQSRRLNTQEDVQAINCMDEQLQEMRRDYKMKEKKSKESASKVILTT